MDDSQWIPHALNERQKLCGSHKLFHSSRSVFFSKIQREVEEQDNAGIIQFGIIGIKKTVILFPENFHSNLSVNSTPKEQIILSSPCILGLRQEDRELDVILHYKSRP